MKITIKTMAIAGIMLLTSSHMFAQENKKAAKARKQIIESQKDVVEAQQDLKEARMDSTEEYRIFKKEAEMEINNNENQIALLKAAKYNGTEKENQTYQERVAALELKNNELRRKIDGSSTMKMDTWSTFKREFKHDMNQLGVAIRDIGLNNTK